MKIPFAINSVKKHILVSWLESKNLDMRFGFFSDSISHLPRLERFAQITTIDTLLEADKPSELKNIGVIFHCARCGSTLLCQMLKQHDRCLVISEPSIINQIINEKTISIEQKQVLVSVILGIYAAWGKSIGKFVVLKTTSWQVNNFQLFSGSLHNSPKIFLYREPAAVIDSLSRRPPSWLSRMYDSNNSTLDNKVSDNKYAAARAYIKNTTSMIENSEDHTVILLNFIEVFQRIKDILVHFNLPVHDKLIKVMMQQARYNAKSRTRDALYKFYVQRENVTLEHLGQLNEQLSSNYAKLTSYTNNFWHSLNVSETTTY